MTLSIGLSETLVVRSISLRENSWLNLTTRSGLIMRRRLKKKRVGMTVGLTSKMLLKVFKLRWLTLSLSSLNRCQASEWVPRRSFRGCLSLKRSTWPVRVVNWMIQSRSIFQKMMKTNKILKISQMGKVHKSEKENGYKVQWQFESNKNMFTKSLL